MDSSSTGNLGTVMEDDSFAVECRSISSLRVLRDSDVRCVRIKTSTKLDLAVKYPK